MQTIGILGGVASGKSAVAEMFVQLGATRLDADSAGHEVLRQSDVRDQLVARWGAQIVAHDGQLDRRAVAARVFGEGAEAATELRFLESVTHPRIRRLLEDQLRAASAQGHAAAILDAAVMLKAGWDQLCQRIVFVEVPLEQRRERALSRGWSAAEFAAREASQSSLEAKRQRAETIIDNSGTLEETFDQVRALWANWFADQE